MKFYVAGRTTDAERCAAFGDALEAEGHTITFKWWGDEGEIRTDLKSEDLELVSDKANFEKSVVEPDSWMSTIRHKPTGETATGEGISKVAAHDVALMSLRAKLNAGWQAKPERARELALREIKAVHDCDVLLLLWAPDILGAATEFGVALGLGKKIYVYRPGRDSVFWYAPNVKQIWTLNELLDDIDPQWVSLDDVKEIYQGGGKMGRRASDHSVSADPTGADRARRTLPTANQDRALGETLRAQYPEQFRDRIA